MKHYDGFDDWKTVLNEFSGTCWSDEEPTIKEKEPRYVFAVYEYECYEGNATVAYFKNNKYYLIEGGHCSCHGLEGQWQPEEYTPKTFKQMVNRLDDKSEYVYGLAKHKKLLLELIKSVNNGTN